MICSSCGYRISATTNKYINCGCEIKAKLSDKELAEILRKSSDRSDELTPSSFDKIIGLILFALAIIVFVVRFFVPNYSLGSFFSVLIAIVAGFVAKYPQIIWEIDKTRMSINANVGDATPTEFWRFSRKISYLALAVLFIVLIVVSFFIIPNEN